MSRVSPPKPDTSLLFQRAGRAWGHAVTRHGRLYLDRRCAAFPLLVSGEEHLRAALQQPCLIVANHVIIRAENAPLGRMTQARLLSLLNQPPDSFVLRRIVREETGRALHVVAKCDRGWWSPRPLVKALQKQVGQPFGKGMMEGMEFVPIEHNPDCFHRTFFQSAEKPLRRGSPLLIFPGRLCADDGECRDTLVDAQDTGISILPGAAHLARKFSLPILPVYLQGCDTWRPDTPTRVFIGPAFSPDGMSKADLNCAIIGQVRALIPPASVSLVSETKSCIYENCYSA